MTQVRVPIDGLTQALHDQLDDSRRRALERARGGSG
jgi:hypothetical protein